MEKKSNPYIVFIGYAILGAIAGFLSLYLFKDFVIKDHSLRIANIFISPVLAGLIMAILGKRREKRGVELIYLDRFSFGFIFAFTLGLIGFFTCKGDLL